MSQTKIHPEFKVGLLFAIGTNGAFGKDGGLPWTIPEDMERFKSYTTDNAVIMGSKTWESLPKKPLPNRINIILTANMTYKDDPANNVFFARTMDKAIKRARESGVEVAWIIGGGKIIEKNQEKASIALVTRVLYTGKYDVEGPKLHDTLWVNTWTLGSNEEKASKVKFNYRFEYFKRKQNPS